MLKKILIVLGTLLAVLLVVPAFLSSQMHISRTIEIESTPMGVHTYLVDLNHYPKWNPFSESDPGSTNQITGSGVGSFLIWKGEKTGEGKMTITQIQPHQRIQLKLEFFKPMPGVAWIEWVTDEVSANSTRVTWSMDQNLPYFQRYFGLVMDGMIGTMFEKGLSNLKMQFGRSG